MWSEASVVSVVDLHWVLFERFLLTKGPQSDRLRLFVWHVQLLQHPQPWREWAPIPGVGHRAVLSSKAEARANSACHVGLTYAPPRQWNCCNEKRTFSKIPVFHQVLQEASG